MTYRDMTFCRGDGCQNFSTCFRALTPEVEQKAKEWWGSDDAPISQFMLPKQLECYVAPLSREDK